jgi:hypothetical protein
MAIYPNVERLSFREGRNVAKITLKEHFVTPLTILSIRNPSTLL